MIGAFDLSMDEGCSLFAQLLDTATSLKKINIKKGYNKRSVRVSIDYAVEADPKDASIVPK